MFEAEQQLYLEEGLSIEAVECPDNREVVELIAGRACNSILDKLDDACAMADHTKQSKSNNDPDLVFNAALHSAHGAPQAGQARAPGKGGNTRFVRPDPKHTRTRFVVMHFAGAVEYECDGMVGKNNDQVPGTLREMLDSSSVRMLSHADRAEGGEAPVRTFNTSGGRCNVSKQFVRDMDRLARDLQASKCSFIRCIKPNYAMRAGVFDRDYVVKQAHALGLQQTCEVLKVGLPTRIRYCEIIELYQQRLSPDYEPPAGRAGAMSPRPQGEGEGGEGEDKDGGEGSGGGGGGGEEEAVARAECLQLLDRILRKKFAEQTLVLALLWTFAVPPGTCFFGKTRLFFRAGQIERIDRLLDTDALDCTWLARCLRRWLSRHSWRVLRAAVSGYHAFLWAGALLARRRVAAGTVQRAWRMVRAQRKLRLLAMTETERRRKEQEANEVIRLQCLAKEAEAAATSLAEQHTKELERLRIEHKAHLELAEKRAAEQAEREARHQVEREERQRVLEEAAVDRKAEAEKAAAERAERDAAEKAAEEAAAAERDALAQQRAEELAALSADMEEQRLAAVGEAEAKAQSVLEAAQAEHAGALKRETEARAAEAATALGAAKEEAAAALRAANEEHERVLAGADESAKERSERESADREAAAAAAEAAAKAAAAEKAAALEVARAEAAEQEAAAKEEAAAELGSALAAAKETAAAALAAAKAEAAAKHGAEIARLAEEHAVWPPWLQIRLCSHEQT